MEKRRHDFYLQTLSVLPLFYEVPVLSEAGFAAKAKDPLAIARTSIELHHRMKRLVSKMKSELRFGAIVGDIQRKAGEAERHREVGFTECVGVIPHSVSSPRGRQRAKEREECLAELQASIG